MTQADLSSGKPRGDWTNWQVGQLKQQWRVRLRVAFLWLSWGNVRCKSKQVSPVILYPALPVPTYEGLKYKFKNSHFSKEPRNLLW